MTNTDQWWKTGLSITSCEGARIGLYEACIKDFPTLMRVFAALKTRKLIVTSPTKWQEITDIIWKEIHGGYRSTDNSNRTIRFMYPYHQDLEFQEFRWDLDNGFPIYLVITDQSE